MTRAMRLRGPIKRAPVKSGWVEALLEFVKWTQGQQPLPPALDALGHYLGASAMCFSRRDRSKPGLRVLSIRDSNEDLRKPRLRQSFALEILGPHLDSLKTGAAVYASDALIAAKTDCDLETWQGLRGTHEILLICLGQHNGIRDILEVHLPQAGPLAQDFDADAVAHSLAEVFTGRRPGLVEKELVADLNQRRSPRVDMTDMPILAPENPAGLTRSEWRICLLIAKGLSRSGAAREMRVTQNTIRTHLRNIYAKTGRETFHDLALRLVSAAEQQALYSAGGERAA